MKSKKNDYTAIVEHYESCFEKYGDAPKGMDWPNEEDAVKRYSVMLDLVKENNSSVSLLDFGCGTSHLLEFINKKEEKFGNLKYSGADISSKFINLSKSKFPQVDYYCVDILKDDLSNIPSFDYAILNGVFTEKHTLSHEQMWEFFQKMILTIFEKVDKGMAFNVMSKAVAWERDDLFHLSTDVLIDFMVKNLSRNFIIRNDYGLYEYTVYLYK